MKIFRLVVFVVVTAVCVAMPASGATTGSALREAAFESLDIDRISICGTYEMMNRGVKLANGQEWAVKGNIASLMLGCDITSFWRVFATGGAMEIEFPGAAGYSDWKFRWSAGMQANVWRVEISDPEFLTGSILFSAIGEYSRSTIGGNGTGSDGEWSDISFDLPITYEMYAEKKDSLHEVPYSLAISVGPAFSSIGGKASLYSGNNTLSEKTAFGVMGAVDVYLADNLSLGAQVHYFDDASVDGHIMLHF